VREVDALEFAGRNGLPVPAVLAADPTGTEVGDGVPALLMSRRPGRPVAAPDPRELATVAATIHDVSGDRFPHRYFRWYRKTSTRAPKHCQRRDRWEAALDLWRTGQPEYEPRFVHRDFHPGNVLWSRGAATGVVDWANACAGPPGIDVAACRWNLDAWAGPAVGEAFVRAYEAVTGRPHDPYWDVAWVLEDEWDLIDDAARVRTAESRLARTLG
jgi:Ser/Thr protein kinase RdoA (MazF antagonist)